MNLKKIINLKNLSIASNVACKVNKVTKKESTQKGSKALSTQIIREIIWNLDELRIFK